MKKILLTICLAAASLTSFAQFYGDYDAPVTFGIKGGVNFASIQQTISGTSSSASSGMATGFHLGGVINFNINDTFTIQPSLQYSMKGGRDDSNYSMDFDESGALGYKQESKLTLHYIHLPVTFLYKVPAGDNKFFFGAGPYLSYGISGKTKGSATISDGTETITTNFNEDVEFGNGEGKYKAFDYGATALVGFKFYNGLFLSANYDLGLGTTASETDPDFGITTSIKNRVIGLSIGYEF